MQTDMNGDNLSRPVDRVLSQFAHNGVRRTQGGWEAHCPAHEDRRESLSVSEGTDGRVLLHCHAGCTVDQIVAALGLSLKDLFPCKGNRERTIVKAYPYRDEHGTLLAEAVRFSPKGFAQRKPDGNGGWVWNLNGTRRVLYRLPEIMDRRTVFLVEGEKDADRLWSLGLPATTDPQGAGKWQPEYNQSLGDKHVVIIPDNDEPGEQHAEHVAQCLLPMAIKGVGI